MVLVLIHKEDVRVVASPQAQAPPSLLVPPPVQVLDNGLQARGRGGEAAGATACKNRQSARVTTDAKLPVPPILI